MEVISALCYMTSSLLVELVRVSNLNVHRLASAELALIPTRTPNQFIPVFGGTDFAGGDKPVPCVCFSTRPSQFDAEWLDARAAGISVDIN